MVKHTQTNRRQGPTNCLTVFEHLVRLGFKGLTLMSFLYVVFLHSHCANQQKFSGQNLVFHYTVKSTIFLAFAKGFSSLTSHTSQNHKNIDFAETTF